MRHRLAESRKPKRQSGVRTASEIFGGRSRPYIRIGSLPVSAQGPTSQFSCAEGAEIGVEPRRGGNMSARGKQPRAQREVAPPRVYPPTNRKPCKGETNL